MGVDFTAILDHGIGGAALDRLPNALDAEWKLPESLRAWVTEFVRANRTGWTWKLTPPNSSAAEELFNEAGVGLDGPDGFFGTIHNDALELLHLARWWSFAYEPEVAQGLREAARLLAGVLGSTTIIYLPDNGYLPSSAREILLEQGGRFRAVEAWLAENVGPPVQSTQELRGEDPDSVNEVAYFIERVQAAHHC